MVKTGEQPQNQQGTADKLSRLKQTLTTGLLQAHESGKHQLCSTYCTNRVPLVTDVYTYINVFFFLLINVNVLGYRRRRQRVKKQSIIISDVMGALIPIS